MDTCATTFKKEDSEDMEFNLYIPPWGLPKEKIPLYIEWKKNNPVTKIELLFKNDFQIVEFINSDLQFVEENENNIKITFDNFRISKYNEKCFIGIVLKSKNVFSELSLLSNVTVIYYKEDQILSEISKKIKLFRPFLNGKTNNKKIFLTDKTPIQKIELLLEKTGFGDIELKVQGKMGGKLFTSGETFLDDLFLDILEKLFSLFLKDIDKGWKKQDLLEINEKIFDSIQIEDLFLQKLLDNMYIKFEKNVDSLGDIDSEEKQLFYNWLNDFNKTGSFKELMPIIVKNTLVNTILRYIGENKNESIKLNNSNIRLRSRIKTIINNIELIINYRDLNNNEYEPLVLKIDIEDNRTIPSKILIEFSIQIKNIEDKSILDIEKFGGNGNEQS